MPDGVQPVTGFDVDRYTGLWHEVARIENTFERGLIRATATYTRNADGTITVVNRGYDESKKEWREAVGKAARELADRCADGLEARSLLQFDGYSVRVARTAQDAITAVNEYQPVCALLDLSLQDVWRYRYALDTGRAGGSEPVARPAEPAQAPAATPTGPAPASTAVPDVTDPVWLRLLDGDLSLDIKVLSLKLMLTKLRSQLDLIHDEEVRLLKLKELHRYFVKNERVLTHELDQLRLG